MLSHEDITKLVEVSTAHGTGDVGLTCLEGCVLKLAHDPVRRMAIEIARHRLAEHERAVAAKDVQEIPSPPLGRELGRSPISTPRRQEREALLSIVRASCEVDTVRKAALALLGEVQS